MIEEVGFLRRLFRPNSRGKRQIQLLQLLVADPRDFVRPIH